MPHTFDPEQTIVIYNPVSGTAKTRSRGKRLIAVLAQKGYRVVHTEAANHASILAKDAVRSGCKALIVAGGDGSLYEVIAKLPAHVNLAYFPGGSVNLFSLNLKIPAQPAEWLRLLETGVTRPVHFGLCNDRSFASIASVGFDAHVVADMHPQLKRMLHTGAYAAQFLPSLLAYNGAKFSVTVGSKRYEENVLGVIVGRGQHYGGSYKILPQCDPLGTELSYLILRGRSKWQLIKFAVGMLTDRMHRMRGITYGSAQSITVQTDPPSYVQLDGDLYGKTPVTFAVEESVRTVLAIDPCQATGHKNND